MGALAAAALLAAAGCQAPLEPESRRTASEAADPTSSPTSSPTSTPTSVPTGRASAGPTAAPPRAGRQQGEVTVPEGLRESVEAGRQQPPVLGGDVGWPQCPTGMGIPQRRTLGLPMPLPEARFVVLGLTNGPGFTPNPCLADQVGWVRERGLLAAAYVVLSTPVGDQLARYGDAGPFDGGSRLDGYANVGYAQAAYARQVMRRAGLRSPVVWLDVEPVPDFDWGPDLAANAAVVRGAARGWTDAGHRVGVYSTAALWDRVVGDLELGLPEWRAAGETSQAEAVRRCGRGSAIQGGPAVMAQWVASGRDLDITCPGTSSRMALWFDDTTG
ncbi:hypothetical protein SAMN04488570_3145 [Nocardioides scoriae]|uniref:Uncharacterized protein n=1 Tax=Nocardioides scoriae TaxID=642780 RepID=A0A1H1WG23_9ACTN|nr:hypothetical protein SAMN04488570_3145 [Nocardioides scoriae]